MNSKQNNNISSKPLTKTEKEKLDKEKQLKEKLKQVKIQEAMKEILEIERLASLNKPDKFFEKFRNKSPIIARRSNSMMNLEEIHSSLSPSPTNSANKSLQNRYIAKMSTSSKKE